MANQQKTYILTPSFDYPPTGPILLGNIITKPDEPDKPLNAGDARVAPPVDALTTTTKRDWKSSISKSHSGAVGVYVKFLEMILGAGVDVGTNWERGHEDTYAFESLETTFFDPTATPGYLEKAMKAPNAVRYLERTWSLKPVYLYIVTGLKTARGGKIKSSRTKGQGGTLDVGIDGTILAAPVSAGPKLELNEKKGEGVEWGASDDFVFAYRLSRLKFKKKSKEIEEEGYAKHALYSDRFSSDDYEETGGGSEEWMFEMVEGDQAIAGEFGELEKEKAEDDGEECICVLP